MPGQDMGVWKDWGDSQESDYVAVVASLTTIRACASLLLGSIASRNFQNHRLRQKYINIPTAIVSISSHASG